MTHQSATSTGRRRGLDGAPTDPAALIVADSGRSPARYMVSGHAPTLPVERIGCTPPMIGGTPVHVSQPIHLDPSRRIEGSNSRRLSADAGLAHALPQLRTPTSGRLCCSSHRGGVFWSAFRHLGQRGPTPSNAKTVNREVIELPPLLATGHDIVSRTHKVPVARDVRLERGPEPDVR